MEYSLNFLLLAFILIFQRISSYLADNKIEGNPEVTCNPDSISLKINTFYPFGGRVFVKGHVQDSNCNQVGSQRTSQIFSIYVERCGLRRSREYNGIRLVTTVIVSFHPIFVTQMDRAYRVNCFYMEVTKPVSQNFDVRMLSTVELAMQPQVPVCRYDILKDGPYGKPVRFVSIGEDIYHRWTCHSEADDAYCMRVHTCFVNDGQGGQQIPVIDDKGCSVDEVVLTNLDYSSDLTAGQQSRVFKFADRTSLYFNCQIELIFKDSPTKCSTTKPACNQGEYNAYPSRPRYENLPSSSYASPSPPMLEIDYEAAVPPYGTRCTKQSIVQKKYKDYQSYERAVSQIQGKAEEKRSSWLYNLRSPTNPSESEISPDRSYPFQETNIYDNSQHMLDTFKSATRAEGNSSPYLRIIKKRTVKAKAKNETNVLKFNLDLPEQMLTVFGLDDDEAVSALRAIQREGIFEEKCRLDSTVGSDRVIIIGLIFVCTMLFTIIVISKIRHGRTTTHQFFT